MNKKNVMAIALVGLIFLTGIFVIAIKYGIMAVRTDKAEAQTDDWTRQFRTPEYDKAIAVAVDSSGIYVYGDTDGILGQSSQGKRDAFIRKYDSGGNIITSFGTIGTVQFGTSDFENSWGIAADSSVIYVVGRTFGTLEGQSAGKTDAFIREYDSDGNVGWTDQFGTSEDDEALGVAVDSSGNIYVVGITQGTLEGQSAGETDAFIRKYDSGGNEEWTKQFGTSAVDIPYAVSVDASGNYIYVFANTNGEFPGQTYQGSNDAFIRKCSSSSGNEIWTIQFGTSGDDTARDGVAESSGIYVVGKTDGILGQGAQGNNDAYIRKYDSGGNIVTTFGTNGTVQFGTSEDDGATGISIDSSGIYVAGYTLGTLEGQSSHGRGDAFVREYDSAGNEIWTTQFGTSDNEIVHDVAVDSSGIYVAGFVQGAGSMDFDALIAKIWLDETPPTTTASLSDSQGIEGWWRTNVTVTLSAIDSGEPLPTGTGIKETKYRVNPPGDWTTYTTPFVVSDEGTNEVEYFSVDNAGNTEATKEEEVKIDKTNPVITKTSPVDGKEYLEKTSIPLTLEATDALSGISSYEVKLDGVEICNQSTACPDSIGGVSSPLTLGSHTVIVEAADKAGNQASDEETFTVITAAEAVGNIIDDVDSLGIKKGVAKSLDAQLDVIKKLLESDKPEDKQAAINMLQAFINECYAQRGKALTDVQADLLIQQAQAIINIL